MTSTQKTPYRPVILIDCDGVLADLVTPVLEEANHIIQTRWDSEVLKGVQGLIRPAPVRPEDLTEYDIAKAYPALRPSKVYEPLARPGFCRSLRPYPGAVAAVKRLQGLGEVYCVTKAHHSPYWHFEREEWLQVVMGIPRDRVIFAADKERVNGHFFIDDSIEHVWSWMDDRGEGFEEMAWEYFAVGFLWDQPYNRKIPAYPKTDRSPPPFTRIRDWETIIKRVEVLAK